MGSCVKAGSGIDIVLLGASIIILTIGLSHAGEHAAGFAYIASYLLALTAGGRIILNLAEGGHKNVLPVVVVGTILLVLFVACLSYSFFHFTTTEQITRLDRVLNIIPVTAAVFAAALGWYVHYQYSSKAQRTNNAFSIVMEMRRSPEFIKRWELVGLHFPKDVMVSEEYQPYFHPDSRRRLEKEKAEINKEAADAEAKLEELKKKLEKVEAIEALRFILNYFEFMAAGIELKELDEDMLYETISVVVVRIYERSSLFLKFYADPKTKEVLAFQHLSALVKSWSDKLDAEAMEVNKKKKRND